MDNWLSMGGPGMGLQGLNITCSLALALSLVLWQANVMNVMLLAHGNQKPCEICLVIQPISQISDTLEKLGQLFMESMKMFFSLSFKLLSNLNV